MNPTTRRVAIETHQRASDAIQQVRKRGRTLDAKISEGKPNIAGLALGTALSTLVQGATLGPWPREFSQWWVLVLVAHRCAPAWAHCSVSGH